MIGSRHAGQTRQGLALRVLLYIYTCTKCCLLIYYIVHHGSNIRTFSLYFLSSMPVSFFSRILRSHSLPSRSLSHPLSLSLSLSLSAVRSCIPSFPRNASRGQQWRSDVELRQHRQWSVQRSRVRT